MPPAGSVNASLSNVSGVKSADVVVGLTLTLDQWCANQRLQPDFIKCDVEGAELLVFRGGKNTLAQARPVVITESLRKWAKPFGYHRSEEQTSELQSLMRNSYAVFCLKKKKAAAHRKCLDIVLVIIR